jgi:hypothetical protein
MRPLRSDLTIKIVKMANSNIAPLAPYGRVGGSVDKPATTSSAPIKIGVSGAGMFVFVNASAARRAVGKSRALLMLDHIKTTATIIEAVVRNI